MKVNFLRAAKIAELKKNIESNLDRYRVGDFNFLAVDSSYTFESELELDESKVKKIKITDTSQNEVENCILMYEAFGNLTPYLARDERLWVYLVHTVLLPYTRNRWPIPKNDADAVKHITKHFFCNGARGIERDNAASRLWWMASICKRAKGLSFKDAMKAFLHKSDVRANIVERPTTSQNVEIFSEILRLLNQSLKSDQSLYERKKFREFMKAINLEAGVRLMPILPKKQIASILKTCAQ